LTAKTIFKNWWVNIILLSLIGIPNGPGVVERTK